MLAQNVSCLDVAFAALFQTFRWAMFGCCGELMVALQSSFLRPVAPVLDLVLVTGILIACMLKLRG